MLSRDGMVVQTAASGEEALGIMRSGKRFDCVISDLMMPGMDGLELMQALQRETPPPVLMAMSGDQAALTQARALTPYTFAKPLPLEQILAAVRSLDLGR
jgi:two-component system response regulator HydG